MSKIEIDKYGVEWITDDLGGVHSEGLGWNTTGMFCGECSNTTYYGCPHIDVTIEDIIEE